MAAFQRAFKDATNIVENASITELKRVPSSRTVVQADAVYQSRPQEPQLRFKRRRTADPQCSTDNTWQDKHKRYQAHLTSRWLRPFAALAAIPQAAELSMPLRALRNRSTRQKQVFQKYLISFSPLTLRKPCCNWSSWQQRVTSVGVSPFPANSLDLAAFVLEHNADECGV